MGRCLSLDTSAEGEPMGPEFRRFRSFVYVTYSTLEAEEGGIACQLKFTGAQFFFLPL